MAMSSSVRLHVVAFKLRNWQKKYASITQAPIGISWRGFSSDTKSKDDSKSDKIPKGEDASLIEGTETDSKKVSVAKKEAISKQLLQQILSMKITGTKDEVKEPLSLARPTWGDRRQHIKEKKRIEKETPREHPDLDPKMVSAIKDVASNLEGSTEIIESELIQKLRSHNAQTEEIRTGMNIGNLVAGLKIDRTRAPTGPGKQDHVGQGGLSDESFDERGKRATFSKHRGAFSRKPMRTQQMAVTARSAINLFGAPPLNIFKETSSTNEAPTLDFPVLETWNKLEEKELQLLVTQPFANAYEEHIQWTKEGKLWKFPINNEQGLDEEAKVGFHEHIFLEPLIEDFPKKGPIRHFMELVLVGLSKNSYLTVQQKKDHIDWFRNYFKDKEAILKEVGVLS